MSLAQTSNHVVKVTTYKTSSAQRSRHFNDEDPGAIESPLDSCPLMKEGGVYEVVEVEPRLQWGTPRAKKLPDIHGTAP